MAAKNLMTPSMLAEELNAGSATVRFWLNRFSKWLPYTEESGERLYHSDALNLLLSISEKIESGMLPTEIEKLLDSENRQVESVLTAIESVTQERPLFPSMAQELQSHGSIKLISALFEKFYSQQERVAAAEERKARAEELKAEAEQKRASAEEQKAEALLRRAEAESHKAHAMNNLADALKTISDSFLHAFSERSRAVSPLSPDGFPPPVCDDALQDKKDHHIATSQEVLDDLVSLISDKAQELVSNLSDDDMDDLSSLIEDEPSQPHSDVASSDMDDLSALIEDEPSQPHSDIASSDMDDLSALIDDEPSQPHSDVASSDMDDLSSLIEDDIHDSLTPNILDSDVDDLLSLIGDGTSELMHQDMLGNTSQEHDAVDDLSALIEGAPADLTSSSPDGDIDDLMALIGDDNKELSPNLFDQESLESAMVEDLPPPIKEDLSPLSK